MRSLILLFAILVAAPAPARDLLPLSDQLGVTRLRVNKNLPKKSQVTMERSVADLRKEGIESRAPKKGDELADFSLPQASGGTVKLSELVKAGPVVVTFYRGSWCPYCAVQLVDYEARMKEIVQAGGKLVAITPEEPTLTKEFIKQKNFTFPILWDQDNAYATQLKIVYGLPEDVKKVYREIGVDLNKSQGNQSARLPVPATFVVDKNRKIVFSYVDADFSKRAETSDLVEAVKEAAK